jgi:hypothetical protein
MTYAGRLYDTSKFLWGGLLLIIGTAMLLDNLDVIYIGNLWNYWPFVVVAIGIGKFLEAKNAKGRGDGLWWVFIGLWLYVSVFHVFGLRFSTSWPLLLVGIGASMIWNSIIKSGTLRKGEVS